MISEPGTDPKDTVMPDPVAVFLTGALVGLSLGPQVVRIAKKALEGRSEKLADTLVEYFRKGAC